MSLYQSSPNVTIPLLHKSSYVRIFCMLCIEDVLCFSSSSSNMHAHLKQTSQKGDALDIGV